MTSSCPRCGATVLGTDLACPTCGRSLGTGAGAPGPGPLATALVALAGVVGTVLLVQLVVSVLNQRAGL